MSLHSVSTMTYVIAQCIDNDIVGTLHTKQSTSQAVDMLTADVQVLHK